jgi:hypothetical protein
MLGANPYFKTIRSRVYTREDAMRDAELEAVRRRHDHNNNVTRPFMGHPRFGFKTMLSGESKGLPTAPAIVGGNVDWTQKAVGPATMFFHHEMMNKRQMMPPPVMGSPLKVSEPTGFSLHTL